MRVSSFAVARPNYYDRSATSLIKSFSGTVAPHGATTRWTTTISAGLKAFIETTHGYVDRQTVAAPGLNVILWARITSGADTSNILFCRSDQSAVGPLLDRSIAGGITLYAGEVFEGLTIDSSTGGTCNFALSSKLTTFTV